MKRARVITAILANFLTVVLVGYSVSTFFWSHGVGNMAVAGTRAFMYFTVDSNLLAAVCCLISGIYLILRWKQATVVLPRWIMLCKLIGTTAVAVTFLTVLLFLGPVFGYASMFQGVNLHLHLICPLLCILSLLLLERSAPLPFSGTVLGVLPTLVYGGVYVYLVIFARRWQDFYGFNIGGYWYLSAGVMLLASWGICVALRAGNLAASRRRIPSC